MVEHATENRSVGGSIPPLGTILIAELVSGPGIGKRAAKMTAHSDRPLPPGFRCQQPPQQIELTPREVGDFSFVEIAHVM